MNSTVTATRLDGTPDELPAVDLGLPGLTVARFRNAADDADLFGVFHAESGLVICWFFDPEAAAAAAYDLTGAAVDWTADAAAVAANPAAWAATDAATAKYRWGRP